MSKTTEATSDRSKRAYNAPSLTVLGSVKELTGTKSAAGTSDAMTMMTLG
jgi:hypothetical protein